MKIEGWRGCWPLKHSDNNGKKLSVIGLSTCLAQTSCALRVAKLNLSLPIAIRSWLAGPWQPADVDVVGSVAYEQAKSPEQHEEGAEDMSTTSQCLHV